MQRRSFLKRMAIGTGGAAALVVLAPLGSRASKVWRHGEPVRRTVDAMGTRVRMAAVPDGITHPDEILAALGEAHAELTTVDRLMSVHRADSDLSRVNLAAGSTVSVDARTLTVAAAAVEHAASTDGALDTTILPLMRYWGFMEERDTLPLERDLGPHVERVGYRQLQLGDGRLGLRVPGCEIDFGSIAKGFAVDGAVARLRGTAHRAALVEAGGDLYAASRPTPERRWTVGIRDPRHPEQLLATVELENEAMATSGGYEKFRVFGNRRVSHLIDPRTGQPAEQVISSTVLAPTTMEADALSTAAYVLGAEAALELVGQRQGVEGVWVKADGSRWISPGLAGRISWA